MTPPRIVAALVTLALAGACDVAYAQGAPDERTAERKAPTYTLEVDSDAPDFVSFDALAVRLSSDLGAEVTRPSAEPPSRAALVVRYRGANRALSVRAVHAGGLVVERSVRADGDAAAVQREAVLLAGNLARDEARELIDALSARSPKEAPTTATPEAEAEAAPEPAPKPTPAPAPSSGPAPPTEGDVVASAAIVYPLATNLGHPRVATWLDISIGYGRVGGVRAVQLGAGVSHASGYVHGTQIAAGLGLTRELRGAQIASVNVAEDVVGAQIGVVNVGRRVKGAQIGLVNVAEDVDGAAIGLVSITKRGIHPIVWSSNLSYMNAGIKFATKYAYTVLAAQYGTLETGLDPTFGPVGALGVHVPVASSFDIETEVAVAHIGTESVGSRASNSWFHARILAGWSFASHLRVFAGGGLRAPFTDVDEGKRVIRPEFMGGVQF